MPRNLSRHVSSSDVVLSFGYRRPVDDSDNDRGGWWVAAQVVAFGLLAWGLIAGGADVVDGAPLVAMRAGGILLLVAAAALAYLGGRTLGENLTPFPEPLAEGALVDHGVYGLVRHPLFGAVVLGGAGLAALRNGAWPWVAVLVLAAFFLAKAIFEERRLVRRFPGYADYQSRVKRRLIPWLL